MGSPSSEEGRQDYEGPQHRVTIPEPFAVGVHEVTRGEFRRFIDATGWNTGNSCRTYEGGEWRNRSDRGWLSPGFSQEDDHPVVCVSWDDARAYVRWLSRQTGKSYRLLSEAEWEYAARAGTTTRYHWGNAIGSSRANCRGDLCRDSYGYTSPVGSFGANAFGLHDVLGNVWEWTEDCWHRNYRGAPTDGRVWLWGNGGECSLRAPRGGSWENEPTRLRSAVRGLDDTGNRINKLGFRVARTLTP